MNGYTAMQEALGAAAAAAVVIARHWPDLLVSYDYEERAAINRFLSDFLTGEDLPR